MYKKTVLSLAMALVMMATVPAIAEDASSLNGEATVEFDATGTLSIINPEDLASVTAFGDDFGTMNIPFGIQSVPTSVQTYTAINRAKASSGEYSTYGVIVTDGRGDANSAWELHAQFSTAFTHTAGTGSPFNATIHLQNGSVASTQMKTASLSSNTSIDIPSSSATETDPPPSVVVMSADDSIGVGSFFAYWNADDITMELANDFGNILTGAYAANIVWTVTPAVNADDTETTP